MTRFLVVVLLAANVLAAIGVVHARHEHRQLFVELTRLVDERDELNIDFGRLQLEQATWAEANRIDQVARARLGMKFPEAGEIVVVRP
ncbi:MAG: cell division protein FtsL [Gammaproteobacteria bacterium]|nr:cell division protein FtsL [Gammaproteobacteria bacterium]